MIHNLEEFLKSEGWILKCYKNCGQSYCAWFKDGFQIDEVSHTDVTRDWKNVEDKS